MNSSRKIKKTGSTRNSIPKQIALPGFDAKKKLSFGGSLLVGKRKEARAVVTNQAMHVVMRSTKARHQHSFLAHMRVIEKLLQKQAEHFGIKLYDMANAGNHLHLLLKVDRRKDLGRFLRSTSGLLVRLVTGTQRGAPLDEKLKNFFDLRPFSRILSGDRDFKGMENYLMINRLETIGFQRLEAREMLARILSLQKTAKFVPLGFS